MSVTLIFAPLFSKISTKLSAPTVMASMSAVWPTLSIAFTKASTSWARVHSISTRGLLLHRTAKCSTVRPFLSIAVISAPCCWTRNLLGTDKRKHLHTTHGCEWCHTDRNQCAQPTPRCAVLEILRDPLLKCPRHGSIAMWRLRDWVRYQLLLRDEYQSSHDYLDDTGPHGPISTVKQHHSDHGSTHDAGP